MSCAVRVCLAVVLCGMFVSSAVGRPADDLTLEPYQYDWAGYGLGNVPDVYLNTLSVSFTVPSSAGSSFATYSLLFGVKDSMGTFFGTRLFWDGTHIAWTVNSETFGEYLNESYPYVPVQPGDKLQADYFPVGLYAFGLKLTNVNTGASNTNNGLTTVGFNQLYFAWDNPWSGCFNYPKEGLEVFNNFNLTCFNGVGGEQCTNGVTWTTGVVKPICNVTAHVDQYPQQVSLTWSSKQERSTNN